MANKYFVWKNGNPQDWQELTGKEYYQLVNSEEGKGRFFAKLLRASFDEDYMFFEATQEVFEKNIKDRNRVLYLSKRDEPYSVTTFSELSGQDENEESVDMEDKIEDKSMSVEDICLNNESIAGFYAFWSQLGEMEREILQQCVFHTQHAENHVSQTKLAKKYNVSRATIARTKKKMCELFKNNEKNVIQVLQKFSNK
ncbi:MAG: hypothetical protein SNH27_12075 [Rikenellaceae bacterium]